MALAFATTTSNFANALAAGEPLVKPPSRPRWALAALLVLCIVPRAAAAWRLDTLCKDGVFYVQLAEGFERGDLEAGLGRLRLNTYPLILARLHRWGLDWELASKLWGVGVSSLVVLPLFGWVRRQFDDRTALCACFLYAIHPKMIEWSPEAIRDPTFWLLWTCSLYAAWRAVAELRLSWFLLSGAVITLALHTRFEGWFLYLPLAWWSTCRYFALAQGRWRIVLGASAALMVCPLALMAVNLTWLASQPHWELGNFGRLEYVALWLQAGAKESGAAPAPATERRSVANGLEVPPTVAPTLRGGDSAAGGERPFPVTECRGYMNVAAPAESMLARMSTKKTAIVFGNTLRRGIGGIFGLFWLAGFCTRPRLWLRRDHAVLFLVALGVAAGIWVHLWYAQATSSRYFLTIVILASGCSALGCLKTLDWLACAITRLGLTSSQGKVALAASLLFIGVLGTAEGLSTRYPGRERDAVLGQWLKRRFGAHQRLATSGAMELVDYYAQAAAQVLPADRAAAAAVFAEWRPVCAVLSRRQGTAEAVRQMIEAARPMGFAEIESCRLPAGFNWQDLVVLERRPRPQIAAKE
ncbi:MAG TPA: glycosyltransferase family 39 protein [Pirellulales bacterium]|nr:glycosyltransferase family 39 protein [Pirellulales bacterium]